MKSRLGGDDERLFGSPDDNQEVARLDANDGTRHFERLLVETAEEAPEKPAPSYRSTRRYGFEVAYVRPNYLCDAAL